MLVHVAIFVVPLALIIYISFVTPNTVVVFDVFVTLFAIIVAFFVVDIFTIGSFIDVAICKSPFTTACSFVT